MMKTTLQEPTARRRESQDRYLALVDRIATKLKPENDVERTLVEDMARIKWRQIHYMSIRARAESQTMPDKTFLRRINRLERARASQYKTFMRCFSEFREIFRSEAQGSPDAALNTGGTRPFSRDSAAITCAGSLEKHENFETNLEFSEPRA
jgi:hypothetical protein